MDRKTGPGPAAIPGRSGRGPGSVLGLADEARITGVGGLADAEDARLPREAALTADPSARRRGCRGRSRRARAPGADQEPDDEGGGEAGSHGEQMPRLRGVILEFAQR